MKIVNTKNRRLKMHIKNVKRLAFLVCIVGFLSGCSTLREYTQGKRVLSAISTGNLKGMSKVDVIKKFDRPVATSKSGVSECWYYAQPKSIWLWFEEDKVDHWEVE